MKIYDKDNIVKILIALIVIFGIIFIIVGERPRPKADTAKKNNPPAQTSTKQTSPAVPATPVPTTTPKTSEQETTESTVAPVTATKQTPATKTPPAATPEATTNTNAESSAKPAIVKDTASDTSDQAATHPKTPESLKTVKLDPKELISNKYKNADHRFMQKALADYNKTHKTAAKQDFNKKDAVNTELSEQGLTPDANQLSMSPKSEEKIAKEEETAGSSLKSLTQLSNPENTESPDINPALLKAQQFQYKYPQRYATSTAIGSKNVYAIDTSTAEVSVLMSDNTYWISLGKPETAIKKPISTYILEGATADSAIVMDTSTAEAWRVTVDENNINWTVIKPFANND